jgi:hypothetical protein
VNGSIPAAPVVLGQVLIVTAVGLVAVFVLRANLADPKDPQPQACAGTIRCHEPSPA